MKKTDYILAIILGIIVLVMFAQVVFRYTLNNSLSWSEELAKYLFIWLCFLGAAVGIRDRIHIGVDFLADRLPVKWKQYLELFNIFLITGFCGIIAAVGFLWVFKTSGTLSPAIRLPLNIAFYAALPTASLLSVVYGIIRITEDIKKMKN